ncbi:MAG: hypothetical protein OXC95_13130 [Dehalococcoidia bacterium]|nr:hypothetical protein [Dehalococcoidia bacterium]
MSDEFWALIGAGIGVAAVVGAMFTFLNMRISDMRKDMRDIAKDLSETIALSEKRTNDRIDGLENNFREEFRQVEARINSVETTINARIDGLDVRLRVVEQGQARVIGAVEMMQTIVVATLRGEQEEVDAD